MQPPSITHWLQWPHIPPPAHHPTKLPPCKVWKLWSHPDIITGQSGCSTTHRWVTTTPSSRPHWLQCHTYPHRHTTPPNYRPAREWSGMQPPSITHWLQWPHIPPPAHHPTKLPPCKGMKRDAAALNLVPVATHTAPGTSSPRHIITPSYHPAREWSGMQHHTPISDHHTKQPPSLAPVPHIPTSTHHPTELPPRAATGIFPVHLYFCTMIY